MVQVGRTCLLIVLFFLAAVLVPLSSASAAAIYFNPGYTTATASHGGVPLATQQSQLATQLSTGQQVVTDGHGTSFSQFLQNQGGSPATIVAYSHGDAAAVSQMAACNDYSGGCKFVFMDALNNNNGSTQAIINYANAHPGSVTSICSATCGEQNNLANNGLNPGAAKLIDDGAAGHGQILGDGTLQNALSGAPAGQNIAAADSASGAGASNNPDFYNTESSAFGQQIPATPAAGQTVPTSAATTPQQPTQVFVDDICNKFFNLGAGTQKFPWDGQYLSDEYCKSVQDLVRRYTPGPCGSEGITNPQVTGIIKLNPVFAMALDKFLLSLPTRIGITSAYRSPGASCSAGDSSHQYGCAVDLGISVSTCDSTCQKLKGSPQTGLQIRASAVNCTLGTKANECNHVEPTNVMACKNKAANGGVVPGAAPPAGVGAGAGAGAGAGTNTVVFGPGITCNTVGTVTTCTASNRANQTCTIFGCTNNGSGPFGGNNQMSQMMTMMMGMQLGQALGQAMGNLFNGSSNANQTTLPAPAPLPPVPLPLTSPNLLPGTATASGTSTIDALIAALNNPAPAASSTSMNAPSPVVVGNSAVGQVQQTPPAPSSGTTSTDTSTAVNPGPIAVSNSGSPINTGVASGPTTQTFSTSPGTSVPPPSVIAVFAQDFSRIPVIMRDFFSRLFGFPPAVR